MDLNTFTMTLGEREIDVTPFLPLIVILIAGIYFLTTRDNAFSRAVSGDENDPKKVSFLYGCALIVFVICFIPAALGEVFQKKWPLIITIVLLVVLAIAGHVYETSGKLKK